MPVSVVDVLVNNVKKSSIASVATPTGSTSSPGRTGTTIRRSPGVTSTVTLYEAAAQLSQPELEFTPAFCTIKSASSSRRRGSRPLWLDARAKTA